MSTSAQPSPANIDQLCINTIRTLAMDAVQKANSGHPGTPMAMAPVAYCLWQQFLRFDPEDPDLAQSRPLRALDGSCIDAALFVASPEPGEGRQSGIRNAGETQRHVGRHPRTSGNSTASAPVIRSIAGPPELKPPRARSVKAWPQASGWRWRANGWRNTSTARDST